MRLNLFGTVFCSLCTVGVFKVQSVKTLINLVGALSPSGKNNFKRNFCMTLSVSNRVLRNSLILSASAAALLFTAGTASALTGAGERIQNQATATYKDALGNDYTSQSNLASVEVKQVYFATLGSDQTRTVASNQTANFQHILTNTGNGEDTYTISVANDVAGQTDSGDFSTLNVYVDANENGVVDAGEVLAASLTLAAGESVSLVVAGLVPTAANGATFDTTLTVTSANGDVTDLTSGGGIDGNDGTNENRATVSGDAVLNVVKSSVHDTSNNTIAYSIIVSNVGNVAAKDVTIYDGIPAGTTLVGSSISGSGFGTGIDANDSSAASGDLDETVLGFDLNGDGTLTDATESDLGFDLDLDGTISGNTIAGVYGFDDTLAPGTTVELNFTVSYDPAALGAGEKIENVARVSADLDDDPNTDDGVTPSTKVTDKVAQSYSVVVSDTGADAADNVNDGGDDDGAIDGTQQVDTAQSGELVYFTHTVQNTGNGTDTFELNINNVAGFPTGTSFTIWNETGTVQLLNTNGTGGVDTGPMDAGETLTLLIKAQLPPSGSSTTPSTYDLVSTSADDPSTSPATDDAEGELEQILAPTVDLSNSPSDGVAANADAYNNDGSPVTTEEVNIGDTATFNLFIQNDSQVADSFQLASGGSFNSVGNTLGALPNGWTVIFRDSGGSVITTTPSIASGQSFALTAEVRVPSVESQALADRTFVVDTAGNDTVNGNADGDGDYGIFFKVTSVNSGASDVKLDAVDVMPSEQITLLQDNAGQIQPGGSIDYPHTLQNDGNTSERVTLSSANGTNNWSNNLLVDTTGDGSPDTPFGSLVSGGTIYVTDVTGTPKAVTLDANLTFPLEPGESTNVVVRVFAPTSAPNGQLDITTLSATFNNGGTTVTNIDRSEVVEAQLRLTKTASFDATCAGAATADLGPDAGFSPTASSAAPGDCIVWQVVARNAGVDVITDVSITDAVPAFSAYKAGSLRICAGDAGLAQTSVCSFSSLSDGAGDDEGTYAAGDVTFTLGSGSAPELTLTQLASGESVTVRFATEVE